MRRGGWIKRRTRLKPRRDRARRVAPHRVRDRAYLDWVKGLRVCFVSVWIERVWLSLMEIEDEQERKDAELDFAMLASEHGDCAGPYDPDHQGADRGAGLKASDDTAVCMCRRHHDHRTGTVNRVGFFEGMTDVEERRFCDAGIAWTREKRIEWESATRVTDATP